jgi:arylformamidase
VTGIDYEVEYNNRARVPENPALMAGWARDAAAYREKRTPRRVSYGPGSRHLIDVFAGDGQDLGQAPLVVFIHGGYWQALDGSSFSHMARGLNAHGVAVAVPTYDLCPQVSVAEIIEEMRQATRELARLSERLVMQSPACSIWSRWFRLRSTRRWVSRPPRPGPQAPCSGRLPPMAASMRW